MDKIVIQGGFIRSDQQSWILASAQGGSASGGKVRGVKARLCWAAKQTRRVCGVRKTPALPLTTPIENV